MMVGQIGRRLVSILSWVFSKHGGTHSYTSHRLSQALVYFNTVLQPLGVRLGADKEVSENILNESCKARRITVYKVESGDLDDPRMQNIAVLAHIDKNNLVPHIEKHHLIQAMGDLMTGMMLERNMAIFNTISSRTE